MAKAAELEQTLIKLQTVFAKGGLNQQEYDDAIASLGMPSQQINRSTSIQENQPPILTPDLPAGETSQETSAEEANLESVVAKAKTVEIFLAENIPWEKFVDSFGKTKSGQRFNSQQAARAVVGRLWTLHKTSLAGDSAEKRYIYQIKRRMRSFFQSKKVGWGSAQFAKNIHDHVIDAYTTFKNPTPTEGITPDGSLDRKKTPDTFTKPTLFEEIQKKKIDGNGRLKDPIIFTYDDLPLPKKDQIPNEEYNWDNNPFSPLEILTIADSLLEIRQILQTNGIPQIPKETQQGLINILPETLEKHLNALKDSERQKTKIEARRSAYTKLKQLLAAGELEMLIDQEENPIMHDLFQYFITIAPHFDNVGRVAFARYDHRTDKSGTVSGYVDPLKGTPILYGTTPQDDRIGSVEAPSDHGVEDKQAIQPEDKEIIPTNIVVFPTYEKLEPEEPIINKESTSPMQDMDKPARRSYNYTIEDLAVELKISRSRVRKILEAAGIQGKPAPKRSNRKNLGSMLFTPPEYKIVLGIVEDAISNH